MYKPSLHQYAYYINFGWKFYTRHSGFTPSPPCAPLTSERNGSQVEFRVERTAPSLHVCPRMVVPPPFQSLLLAKLSKRGVSVCSRTDSSPALQSAVYQTPVIAPPQHRIVLSTPQTFESHTPPCMAPSAPKLAHSPFPRLGAHPARLAPHRCQCLTPLLRRGPTRALLHPRAPRHRSNKSRCVCGEFS